MHRELTTHAINPCNERLIVLVLDGPGPGGASHVYDIGIRTSPGNKYYQQAVRLCFQNGPVKENGDGVNGLTHEALLAVLIDRMQGFQAGPYACPENAAALNALRNAMTYLHERTQRREAAGIEGTMALDPADRRERVAAAAEQLAVEPGATAAEIIDRIRHDIEHAQSGMAMARAFKDADAVRDFETKIAALQRILRETGYDD